MGLNINTIVPAVEKAKNIATEQYVDTSIANVSTTMQGLINTEAARDGNIVTYYQSTAPNGGNYGDYWLDTDDVNYLVYRKEGVGSVNSGTLSWVVKNNNEVTANAIQVAYKAKKVADGKITTFYQTTVPSATAIGDLWIDTDDNNKMYRASSIGAAGWVVVGVDASASIASNNDVFAQKLGYANYNAMVSAASSGHTVINGGYINTGLIQANAIVANQINTTGLIADDIRATIISGKTFTGGVINGAVINGAVVKASYLDLDGELEVLTNYHITLAMYSANPSLYTDAVYLSVTNEYRIPSMSTIIGPNLQGFYTPSSFPYSPMSYTSSIYAYNIANVGFNSKAVKARPTITFDYSGRTGGNRLFYGKDNTEFYIKIGSMYLIRCIWGGDGSSCTVSGMGATVIVGPYSISHYYALGIDFTVQKYANIGTVSVNSTFSFTLASDWNTSGGITTGCIGGNIGTIYHPKISINNMI